MTNCSEKHESQTSLELYRYGLDINSTKKDMVDFIDSVELVALEETNNSLMSTPNRVSIAENYYAFFSRSGSIWIFKKDGKFFNHINLSGSGPNQYKDITDLWIVSDTINIHSAASTKIVKVDIEGNFLSSKIIPFRAGHVLSKDSRYYVDTNFNTINDTLLYHTAIFDEDWNLIDAFLEINELPKSERRTSNPPVVNVNNNILYHRMYTDTVYQYHENKLEKHIHFDFGEDWFWNDKSSIRSESFGEIPGSNQVWEISSSISHEKIYVKGIVGHSHWEHFLIDRSTNHTVHLRLPKFDGREISLDNLVWENNQLLFATNQSQIKEFVEYLTDHGIKTNIANEDVWKNNHENPIIVKVGFK
jgi:hypothetical protein